VLFGANERPTREREEHRKGADAEVAKLEGIVRV